MKINLIKLIISFSFILFGLYKFYNEGFISSYLYFMIGLIFYFLFKLSK